MIWKSSDELNIYKYISNLQRLMLLISEDDLGVESIELYIYLITQNDLDDNTSKVFGDSDSGYQIYFYSPETITDNFSSIWENYQSVAEYLLLEKRVDKIFEKERYLLHESIEYVQEHIKRMILN